VIPAAYLAEATKTNPFILENEPEQNWCYGHGFWVNDHGKQFPSLPRDSFNTRGAGAKITWVCPSLGLVVTQNPGPWNRLEDGESLQRLDEIHARILDALKDRIYQSVNTQAPVSLWEKPALCIGPNRASFVIIKN